MEGMDVHRLPNNTDISSLSSSNPQPVYPPRNPFMPSHSAVTIVTPQRQPNRPQLQTSGSASNPILLDSPYSNPPQNMQPLAPSANINRLSTMNDDENSFGSSLVPKPSKHKTNSTSNSNPSRPSYHGVIKPATPGAFDKKYSSQTPTNIAHSTWPRPADWPVWLTNGQPNPTIPQPVSKPIHATQTLKPINRKIEDWRDGINSSSIQAPMESKEPDADDGVQQFDLTKAGITREDYLERDNDPEKHMRRLLAAAIGDDGGGDINEGDDIVEGFSDDIRLMPHQIRGLRFMRKREDPKHRNYGGILADDMGLGKTVQTLACIVTGPPSKIEKKQGQIGTLIVAPLAVMEQWKTEVQTKTRPGQLSVTTHHGPGRVRVGKDLTKFDVVITTFSTLASEHSAYEKSTGKKAAESDSDDSDSTKKIKKRTKGKSKPYQALFEVNWLRVVIDEAQNIKNRKTQAAKAAVALQSRYRWCLTGTPIQNNVEELYSLFLFLRLKPLMFWDHFKSSIIVPLKEGRTKVAMKRLHVLLSAVMLRRTKDAEIDGKKILHLPGRTLEVIDCPFDEQERQFYNNLEIKLGKKLDEVMDSKHTYTSVLTMLLRLRQACCHPSLVTKSMAVDFEAVDSKPAGTEDDEADELADMLGGLGVTKGLTCQICFAQLEPEEEKHCSDCAQEVEKQKKQSSNMPADSAKIRMMIKLLRDVEVRSDAKEKTIVFSQFTSFLDLLEPFVKQAGLKYVRYDGSMRNDLRQESLHKIKHDPDVRVILISFKAGSTGLNLTCCNNVILMDLWWNPALEDQAFDRAHRLGQKRDVNIFKLTISETVEDRILNLQNKKRELAAAALSGKFVKGLSAKATLQDLIGLFRRHHHEHDDDDDDDDDDFKP